MVSDQEIAKGIESVLRQSDPNTFTSLNGVVQHLEAKLGLDLSHKAGFIRDQINLLLRSHPQPRTNPQPPKDQFAQQYHSHSQGNYPIQFSSYVALQQYQQQLQQQQQQQQQHRHDQNLNFRQYHPQPPQTQPSQQPQLPPGAKSDVLSQTAVAVASSMRKGPKQSAPVGVKRKGGAGGLTKVCGVSPELQAVVGEPALPRTEIVKQLWVYIRKHNLQDPTNKRKIICDDTLRILFETDCTDMFKMNKLLAKHIIPLQPTKEPGQAKRLKVEAESTSESVETGPSPVIISEALSKFFNTGEREMLQSEVLKHVWEYIKVNHLEDPMNPMAILCDQKLQELLGCESISALGINEMLARHHLFKRS